MASVALVSVLGPDRVGLVAAIADCRQLVDTGPAPSVSVAAQWESACRLVGVASS